MKLSIIIINYNVKYFLELCLLSVRKAVAGIEAEIFVADNASTDGSEEYLKNKFPEVQFRWNKENDGFGKANNKVLKESKGEFILFLNPDTVLPEDCLRKCLAFANEKNDLGALGVRMIDGSGIFLKESKRSFPSPSATIFKMAGLTYLFPTSKFFSGYYAGHLKEKMNNEVDVLAGAFMMIKKEVLQKTGGFDEDFFMYGEDVDLSYRIQLAGYKNYYFSDTVIIHFKGESTQRKSKDYVYRFYGAMNLFVRKHTKSKNEARVMFTGISVAKAASLIKLKFTNKENNNTRDTRTAVIATQQRFDQLLQLIRHAAKPLLIVGRIVTNENDKGSFIGKVNEPQLLIKNKAFGQLIFAEGEMSFKEIIDLIQLFKKRFVFLFHANGSKSIVGSSHKNQKGFFISEE